MASGASFLLFIHAFSFEVRRRTRACKRDGYVLKYRHAFLVSGQTSYDQHFVWRWQAGDDCAAAVATARVGLSRWCGPPPASTATAAAVRYISTRGASLTLRHVGRSHRPPPHARCSATSSVITASGRTARHDCEAAADTAL